MPKKWTKVEPVNRVGIPCPYCGEVVEPSNYSSHIDKHTNRGDQIHPAVKHVVKKSK